MRRFHISEKIPFCEEKNFCRSQCCKKKTKGKRGFVNLKGIIHKIPLTGLRTLYMLFANINLCKFSSGFAWPHISKGSIKLFRRILVKMFQAQINLHTTLVWLHAWCYENVLLYLPLPKREGTKVVVKLAKKTFYCFCWFFKLPFRIGKSRSESSFSLRRDGKHSININLCLRGEKDETKMNTHNKNFTTNSVHKPSSTDREKPQF